MAKNTQPFIFDYQNPDWSNYVREYMAAKTPEEICRVWEFYHKKKLPTIPVDTK